MAFSADPRVDAHTVVLLTFDEGTADTAKDLSDQGLDGKLNGVDRVEGKLGKCVRFTDDGDSVLIGPDPKLDFVDKLTLEAWIKPDNLAARMDVICKHEGGAYAFIIDVGLIKPCHHVAGNYVWGVAKTKLQEKEWVYVATTYDGKAMKVYINGELDGEHSAQGNLTPTNVPLALGGNPGAGGVLTSFFYKGLVDEFRVSKVARTEEEIKTAMNPPSVIKPAGKLAVIWGDLKVRF
jgi:hypothetical protein